MRLYLCNTVGALISIIVGQDKFSTAGFALVCYGFTGVGGVLKEGIGSPITVNIGSQAQRLPMVCDREYLLDKWYIECLFCPCPSGRQIALTLSSIKIEAIVWVVRSGNSNTTVGKCIGVQKEMH